MSVVYVEKYCRKIPTITEMTSVGNSLDWNGVLSQLNIIVYKMLRLQSED